MAHKRLVGAAKKVGGALLTGSKKLDKAVSKHKWTIASLAAGGPVGAGLKIGAGKAVARFARKAASTSKGAGIKRTMGLNGKRGPIMGRMPTEKVTTAKPSKRAMGFKPPKKKFSGNWFGK